MAEVGRFDAFVSYAHEDEPWAKTLAENLHRLGLTVWLDQWELVGGQRLASRLQDGLARAGAVVTVVSRPWVESGWCGEEFDAAVAAAVRRGQRLIPILVGEAELPPFIASRLYIDFRYVASPEQYLERVRQLERAVRGLSSAQRPERGGALVVPDAVGYRPDGPTHAELRVGTGAVAFSTVGGEVSCVPRGVDRGLEQRLWMLQRARTRATSGLAMRRLPPLEEAAASGGVTGALVAVGGAMSERFVCGAVAAALAREEQLAQARHASLRIGLRVDDPRWVDLPWETLTIPGAGRPLVLSEQVELYRTVQRESAPVAVQVPGPLRILAVVASPESGGGELLDYEGELGRILDAVDPARSGQGTYVRVLNWGSLAEIRAALEQERFHVLHLSCHAEPGVLLLEGEQGQVDEADAQRFIAEGLPADRAVPLVVLAGCSTARTPVAQDAEEPEELPSGDAEGSDSDAERPGADAVSAAGRVRAGLARALLERGVPAVLAMTEAVTDHYATELAAEMYEALARAEHPNPLTALSQARRTLETRRRQLPDNDPRAAWPEWATPALFLAGPPLPLFDRAPGADRVPVVPEIMLDEGMVVRKVGEFVGRRAELRRLLSALRDPQRAGVLVHGIGGVGKSTLTAELLHHYSAQGRLIVPVAASTTRTVDDLLETLRQRLNTHCVTEDLPETDPLRRVVVVLADASSPWRERWQLVRQAVLPRLPVLMVLDNAEDLLVRSGDGWGLSDPALAAFLTAWAAASPRTRLLVTSRYPFSLSQRAHKRLTTHHLGPLSPAETRKLIWRLPGLDALTPAERQRAYTDVGGHPRALEYLDALLRGGQARFPDIADRMETALENRGIPDPEGWLAHVAGDLDTALAETVTLAVDDILLDILLDQLEDVPGARRLLDGMAIYRTPVDSTGAAWQLSQLTTPPEPDPALHGRLQTMNARIAEARAAGAGLDNHYGLTPEAITEYETLWGELLRPPVDLDGQGRNALKRLLELGLVSPAPAPQDEPGSPPSGLTVHHWTADALRGRAHPDTLKAAHQRAAAYWQWHVNVWPQPPTDDIKQLIEARHHHHQAGDVDQANAVTGWVCAQLHTWGAWDWEQQLVEESLTWVPNRSGIASSYIHQLGIIAQERGDYRQAEEHYRASLTISEELGDRSGIAISYHQLGIIAQERGDYRQAEERYRASLTILEELSDRSGIASSYSQLGIIAQERGDYRQAEEHYRASLTISEELGNRSGIATGYHQLGIIAQLRGDYRQAEEHCRAALTIKEKLGNRSGIANSYGQLGIIAQERGDNQQAEEHYRAALTISEEIGNRSGIANCYHQLGIIAQERGDNQQAEEHYRAALTIKEEIGDRSGIANSYGQLGIIAQERGDYREAEEHCRASLTISEEIGNRSGIANCYHQLGIIAQERGDNQQAEEHYRAALTISEEIGNRSGIASSYGQLGILRTEQQRPAEGVAHMLEALVLQLEIGRPPDTTLYWLGRQRALLGDDDFRSILNDLVTDDVAAAIMNAAPPQNEPPPHEESTG
ncbi:tetratricopeptide repeat protein [Streptomyces chartreusis]|uniref:tetratricopeptide repeat protein n=3 Tax=Streptomyces chartreusis TaxID=1969 RepID=UPI00123D2081|nr:tetratricopeptide repeat protein [Streptomyces chartreusis]QEV68785.1 TIR domain-containing protein [Streptomyces chartreusis]